MKKIVFFTDCMSISPEELDENLMYPGLVEKSGKKYKCIVKGSSGTTTEDSLNDIDDALNLKPDYIYYGYGVNDALPRGLHRYQRAKIIRLMFKLKISKRGRLFLRKNFLNPLEFLSQYLFKSKYYITEEETRDNVIQIIEKCKKNNVLVSIIGINPVKNYRFRKADVDIIRYNRVLKKICDEYSLEFIDVYKLFTDANLDEVLDVDKFHYSAKGHNLVASEILKRL